MKSIGVKQIQMADNFRGQAITASVWQEVFEHTVHGPVANMCGRLVDLKHLGNEVYCVSNEIRNKE